MRVLFASENLQLGALAALELRRLSAEFELDLVAIWGASPKRSWPSLGRHSYEALLSAESVTLPRHVEDQSVLMNGVHIADYSQLAEELDTSYQHIPRLNERAVQMAMRAMKIDVAIMFGHSQILKRSVREIPQFGWLNLHPSLLPRHRGPFPGFWELKMGDELSGVSLHTVIGKIDGGSILDQESFPIEIGLTFSDMIARQASLGAKLLKRSLVPWLSGDLEPLKQDASQATYEAKPEGKDFLLTPEMRCRDVEIFVSGLRDAAKVLVAHQGKALYIVESLCMSEIRDDRHPPGSSRFVGHERLRYRCADGWVELMVYPFQMPRQRAGATRAPVNRGAAGEGTRPSSRL